MGGTHLITLGLFQEDREEGDYFLLKGLKTSKLMRYIRGTKDQRKMQQTFVYQCA